MFRILRFFDKFEDIRHSFDHKATILLWFGGSDCCVTMVGSSGRSFWIRSQHGMSLSRSSCPISKHRCVVSIQHILHERSRGGFVNLLLWVEKQERKKSIFLTCYTFSSTLTPATVGSRHEMPQGNFPSQRWVPSGKWNIGHFLLVVRLDHKSTISVSFWKGKQLLPVIAQQCLRLIESEIARSQKVHPLHAIYLSWFLAKHMVVVVLFWFVPVSFVEQQRPVRDHLHAIWLIAVAEWSYPYGDLVQGWNVGNVLA